MQRNRGGFVVPLLMMLVSVRMSDGMWLKRYMENYHRSSYYNRAHNSSMHVDYNREVMDLRDVTTVRTVAPTPQFDPKVHLSYYVHILYKGSVFCSGALVSRRMIVTSSRCFLATEVEPNQQFSAKHMTVLTGNDIGTPMRKVWQIIAFYMPGSTQGQDILHTTVILALERKLDPPAYRHIRLYREVLPKGAQVEMSFVDSYTHDLTLFKSKVVDLNRCKSSYESGKVNVTFEEEFFCVKNKQKGGCSTRPGDPVIFNNKLAGINLYGEHCDELEGNFVADIYFAIKFTLLNLKHAADLLEAFTSTGPYKSSATTKRTKLYVENTTLQVMEKNSS